MRNQIVKEIMVVVNAVVAVRHSDLVFDTSGQSLNGVPIIAYVSGVPDASDAVIVQLNRSQHGNAGSPSGQISVASIPAPRPINIAIVDMNWIFSGMGETKAAETEINQRHEAARQVINEMVADKQSSAAVDAYKKSEEDKLQNEAKERRNKIVDRINGCIKSIADDRVINLVSCLQ